MIKFILRAFGIMKAERTTQTKETTGERFARPAATNARVDLLNSKLRSAPQPLPKLKLKDQPGLDLLALQARFAKNEQNGKRRHHKPKSARP